MSGKAQVTVKALLQSLFLNSLLTSGVFCTTLAQGQIRIADLRKVRLTDNGVNCLWKSLLRVYLFLFIVLQSY